MIARCTVAVLMAGLVLCGCDRGEDVAPWPAGGDMYGFEAPDAAFELPPELDEISGLAVLDSGQLAAVQDEEGVVFILDPSTGSVVEERPFAGAGDYEAIARTGEHLLVLESDGTLYRMALHEDAEAERLTLELPGRCDAEGLRYDASGDRLLVSCKDEPGPNLELERAIYAFALDGQRIGEEPAYVLDSRAFSQSIEDHPVNEAVRSVLSERVDMSGFRPSELAVHPVTGDLFVLSSVRGAVIAVGRDGQVVGIWKLPDTLLEQPEGLDFLPNGDLFLSSEAGDRKRAVLLRYSYRGPREAPAE